MKKHEIKVGGHYQAKVGGKLTTVRVDSISEVEGRKGGIVPASPAGTGLGSYHRKTVPAATLYGVTNLATGRKTTFRSAAKFRSEVRPLDPRNKCSKCGTQLTGLYPGGFEPVVCYTCKNTPDQPATPNGTPTGDPDAGAEGEQGSDPTRGAKAAAPTSNNTSPTTGAAPTLATDQHRPGQPGYKANYYRDDGTCWCQSCYAARKAAGLSHTKDSEPAGTVLAFDAEARGGDEQCPDPTIPVTNPVSSAASPQMIATATRPSSAVLKAVTPPTSGGLAAHLAGRRMAESSRQTPPHVIVVARAGTGKTTTLVEGLKVVKGLPTTITPSPQQAAVWEQLKLSAGVRSVGFCAFNRSIAAELKTRVPAGCDAMTMHSLGLKAVTRTLGRLEVNEYVVEDVIADLLGKDVRQLRRDCPVVLRATKELVSLCKMNLRDGSLEDCDELARHYDVELTDGDWGKGKSYRAEVFDLVPRVLAVCREPRGRIDYDDMIWLPVALDLPVFRYDLLLIDEAQDLNRCQQALAKKAGTRLVLCGDPRQAIYGFAGADAESMPRMSRELGVTPAGVVELPLTVTRRCGKAIVAEARKIVPDFEAHESNPKGSVRTACYPVQGGGKDQRGEAVERTELEWEKTYCAQVRPGDFLLCRVNAPLVSQCFRFLKRGIKATIQGRDIGKGLVALVKRLANGSGIPELVGRLDDWLRQEEAKEHAKRNPSEARLIALQDKHACLACFMDGAATVEAVVAKIELVFTDDKNAPGVRLSSIHKAKGLEARRVFFLRPQDGPCPHPMAKSAWQQGQEQNLCYVAITRAIEELVYVS